MGERRDSTPARKPRSDGMKVVLTGGAGDLGTVLTPLLEARGDTPLRLDIVPPQDPRGIYLPGSILDRDGLMRWLAGVDSVVHIAAWHGIHETAGAKDAYAFWDLNVTGTMNVFEAAHRAGVKQVVYLSSTSVRHRTSLYGHTKVLGEEIAQTYSTRHGMRVVILRPRGFIPHWNRAVYASFVAWLQWFWRGAVHIEDVAQAVVHSLERLATPGWAPPMALVVDGAYEYTAADLAAWDAAGPGSTFQQYYAPYEALARRYGLPLEEKPFRYDISATQQWLEYVPRYGLRQALEELAHYGSAGPPGPSGRGAPPAGGMGSR
jgi:nucleoside-diphosphate-sugar epimerase